MTEIIDRIEVRKNIYLYGKYYDTSKFRFPSEDGNCTGIIIYTAPIKNEKSTSLSSLEGMFICDENLDNESTNRVLMKEDMWRFAEKHKGNFIPFKN
jgi:hypothetical protein